MGMVCSACGPYLLGGARNREVTVVAAYDFKGLLYGLAFGLVMLWLIFRTWS